MIADEAAAIFRFTVTEVDPEHGDSSSGEMTHVEGTYEAADVLWGTPPYDYCESGVCTFSFVLPGGTLTWETSEPLFTIAPLQYYPGATYLGFFYHSEWDVSPMVGGPQGLYREYSDNGKSVFVNESGHCLAGFDETLGPMVGYAVTDSLPIYGPLWQSERLEFEVLHGDGTWGDVPEDSGYASYGTDTDSPENWADNLDNCPNTATIQGAVIDVMTSYSPVSTTFVSETGWDWDDEPDVVDDTGITSNICWVDYDIPYTCADVPEYPERDAVLETFDHSTITGFFSMDDFDSEMLRDWSGGGDGTTFNEGSLTLDEDPLIAGQGRAIAWQASAYAEIGQTRWNYIHQTADFTVMAWFVPSGEYQEPIVASSRLTAHKGFRLEIVDSKVRAIFTNGSSWKMLVSDTTLSTGTKYHAAVTGDGTNYRLYINGQQEGSALTVITATGDASNVLRVGRYPTTTLYFEGTLDELVFLDEGASAAHIASYYDGSKQHGEFDVEDTSDMTLWLDTQVIGSMWTTAARTTGTEVDSDNDPIQAIDDLSGSGNHLTYQTTAPTYQSTGFNDEPTARFAGGNHEWRRSSMTNATPQTVVFVGRNDDSSYGFVVTSGGGGSTRIPLLLDTAPVTGVGPGYSDSSYAAFYDEARTDSAVYVAVFDSSDNVRFYLDGIQLGDEQGYSAWSNTNALLRVGGGGSTPDYDLSELRIYDRALSRREVESLSKQLRAKWGL